MSDHERPQPLAGIRVIELARILAGPWAGQTLADLGADVVKVESPAGDDTREWGPPFVTYDDGGRDAAYFHACNRGKRSISLNFSEDLDRRKLIALVKSADVLIENFKVGGLKKFGLDYDSLKVLNPGLIYCSITGFGQNGPYASRPGYDFIIQGMSGIMSLTGERDGEPQKVGVAFADIFTALYSVIAIQAALAERRMTGQGSHIDMALLDSQVAVLANQALNYFVSGSTPTRIGNAHPNIVPYQVFETSDGHLIIAVGNDRQFGRLCAILGLDNLADSPDYATNEARVENREKLCDLLATTIALWRRDELLAQLDQNGVPGGPINDLDDVFGDPQIRHRQLQGALSNIHLANGSVPTLNTPIMLDGNRAVHAQSSPRLNENAKGSFLILPEIG